MSTPPIENTVSRPEAEQTMPPTSGSTRISRAWRSLSVAIVVLVIMVVFALQNTTDVQVRFLGLRGELPLAILLLLVAVLGALIVSAFGTARVVQLRRSARRGEVGNR